MYVKLFSDGAARGNPEGPGGYGVVLQYVDSKGTLHEREYSAGYKKTTNNRMELLAVILGLEAIRWQNAEVEIWSDSAYVVNAVNKGWLWNWIAKGFKGKKNRDLWLRFAEVYRRHSVTFHWLKGHAGHPENERCDTLAVEAGAGTLSRGGTLPRDEGYERSQEKLLTLED